MLTYIEDAEGLAELQLVPEFTRSFVESSLSLTSYAQAAADKAVGYKKPSKTRDGIIY